VSVAENLIQRQQLVLVTDFDGTLYRGDAPVRYYAQRAGRRLAADARRELLDGLDRYLDQGAPALPEAVDGWEAVAALGRRHGLGGAALDSAFAETRAYMAGPGCALEVPAGYARALAGLRAEGVRVVLATNSPAEGLDALLRRLEVLPLLDEVVAGTGKPAGLERLLRRELEPGPGSGPESGPEPGPGGASVLVIGDHWRNDVEPGLRVGAVGVYIDRFGRADGPAHATAPLVEDLLDTVRSWAAARPTADRS
jgi:FMN phosphatase YigB (HAD superfamily)